KTDDNDRGIKVKKALRFLSKGDKVQFRVKFRGRERAHRELAAAQLNEIATNFGELIKIERSPAMDGRDMLMILAPQKKAFDKLLAEKPNAIPTEAEVEGDDDLLDDDDMDTPTAESPEAE
ncbi:MAG: translation initiation factor IF-3 C-terminal domain-containing protein, partial [Phycisphaerales bacterium]|nr:translation initiation factor IF-3 C-terminal domain-containing protein [Phycisphaerales bacterium]